MHHFNADGPDGLRDHWTGGPACKLSAAQLVELAVIVDAGPDLERDGVVRWRRILPALTGRELAAHRTGGSLRAARHF